MVSILRIYFTVKTNVSFGDMFIPLLVFMTVDGWT